MRLWDQNRPRPSAKDLLDELDAHERRIEAERRLARPPTVDFETPGPVRRRPQLAPFRDDVLSEEVWPDDFCCRNCGHLLDPDEYDVCTQCEEPF